MLRGDSSLKRGHELECWSLCEGRSWRGCSTPLSSAPDDASVFRNLDRVRRDGSNEKTISRWPWSQCPMLPYVMYFCVPSSVVHTVWTAPCCKPLPCVRGPKEPRTPNPNDRQHDPSWFAPRCIRHNNSQLERSGVAIQTNWC